MNTYSPFVLRFIRCQKEALAGQVGFGGFQYLPRHVRNYTHSVLLINTNSNF